MHILCISQHGSLIPTPSKEENIFSWTKKKLESPVQNRNHVYVWQRSQTPRIENLQIQTLYEDPLMVIGRNWGGGGGWGWGGGGMGGFKEIESVQTTFVNAEIFQIITYVEGLT
jgi:hypothetical protein